MLLLFTIKRALHRKPKSSRWASTGGTQSDVRGGSRLESVALRKHEKVAIFSFDHHHACVKFIDKNGQIAFCIEMQ